MCLSFLDPDKHDTVLPLCQFHVAKCIARFKCTLNSCHAEIAMMPHAEAFLIVGWGEEDEGHPSRQPPNVKT
jgi:hypothetical protein